MIKIVWDIYVIWCFLVGGGLLNEIVAHSFIKNIFLVQSLIKWGEEEPGHPAAVVVFA